MIYLPAGKKIAIIPNLADLPATIRLPRNKQPPFQLLIASGIWFMIAPFLIVFSPWDFHGVTLFGVLSILFVFTLGALLGGISALRRYASNDEIKLCADHVDWRRYDWIKTQNLSIPISEFTTIWRDQQIVAAESGPATYHLIGLTHSNPGLSVPIFIHQDRQRADHFAHQLEQFITLNRSAS